MRRPWVRRSLAVLLSAVLILGILPQSRAAVVHPAPPEPPAEQTIGEVDTITLEWAGMIETRVESTSSKENTVQYELRTVRPTQPLVVPLPAVVCADCNGGEAKLVGSFQEDSELIFYLIDRTYGKHYARRIRTTRRSSSSARGPGASTGTTPAKEASPTATTTTS